MLAVLNKLYTPEACQKIMKYFVDSGVRETNPYIGQRANVAHSLPMFEAMLKALTPQVARLKGESLTPSYSYLINYTKGAILNRHTDNDLCIYTLSLLVEDNGAEWPLYIEDGGKVNKISLKVGDAVFFEGERCQHWRDPFPKNIESYSILLFHYVPAKTLSTA